MYYTYMNYFYLHVLFFFRCIIIKHGLDEYGDDSYAMKTTVQGRTPQPPGKARGNNLFRGGGSPNNDSPKQKQIRTGL